MNNPSHSAPARPGEDSPARQSALQSHTLTGAQPDPQSNAPAPAPLERGLWIAAILFGCMVCLYTLLMRTSFWEDELIAITHANQPLPLFFIELLRNDIHPPLYFLQLKWWNDLGLSSDRALWLNSFCWAMVSLVTLYQITRRHFGRQAALYATAILASAPIFAYSAANLRMYALVPCLALLVWHANTRWFSTRRWSWLLGSAASALVLAYMHAIEFYFVAFIVLSTLVQAFMAQQGPRAIHAVLRSPRFGWWLVMQLVTGALMLPLAGSAIVRGSDAGAPDSLFFALTVPGSLIAGWGPDSITPVRLAGFAMFIVFAIAGLRNRSSRAMTLVVPVGALALAIAVSVLAKPMLKTPVFAANLIPFLALGAGAGLATLRGAWLRKPALLCVLVTCCAAIPLARFHLDDDSYLLTARYLKQRATPGDVVAIPSVSIYWGVLRYAVAENWGKPLEIMPKENNAQWARLTEKLGPSLAATLGLIPRTNFVSSDGVRYVIGSNAVAASSDAGRVWVVQKTSYQHDVEFGKPFKRRDVTRAAEGDLIISSFEADPAGSSKAGHPMQDAALKPDHIPVSRP